MASLEDVLGEEEADGLETVLRPSIVQKLKDSVGSGGYRWAEKLDEWLMEVYPLGDPGTEFEGSILDATDFDHRMIWEICPDDVQRLVVTMVAADIRSILEEKTPSGPVTDSTEELERAIRRLTAHVQRGGCGYVHGLARDHAPNGVEWSSDAMEASSKIRKEISAAKGKE